MVVAEGPDGDVLSDPPPGIAGGGGQLRIFEQLVAAVESRRRDRGNVVLEPAAAVELVQRRRPPGPATSDSTTASSATPCRRSSGPVRSVAGQPAATMTASGARTGLRAATNWATTAHEAKSATSRMSSMRGWKAAANGSLTS